MFESYRSIGDNEFNGKILLPPMFYIIIRLFLHLFLHRSIWMRKTRFLGNANSTGSWNAAINIPISTGGKCERDLINLLLP